jgi:hypothetical protein
MSISPPPLLVLAPTYPAQPYTTEPTPRMMKLRSNTHCRIENFHHPLDLLYAIIALENPDRLGVKVFKHSALTF